jgi:ribosomal protein S18 acetylase RimI-like enzyme
VVKRKECTYRLHEVTREQFVNHLTDDPADKFAKTFRSKADMQDLWPCIGAWRKTILLGAIAWTVTKKAPQVGNLQLLHTFNKHRGRNIGSGLCLYFLRVLCNERVPYFRVSSEPGAVVFYRKLGIKFVGRQKTALLAIGKIEGTTFHECNYSLKDEIVQKAIYRKGKGGCIEVFKRAK